MAIKYLLLPEDMYRGLLSTNNENDEINLDYTKKNLNSVIKKKINPNAKNLLYNQELRRYLALRKESKSKPIKVELSNGANIVVSQNPANVKNKKNTVQAQLLDSDDDGTGGDEIPILDTTLTADNIFKTPEQQTPKRTKFLQTPQSEDPRVRAVKASIMADPSKFGVRGEGILGPTNRLVKGSDIIKSLEYIANKSKTFPEPPGTKNLHDRLKDNPEILRILSLGDKIPPEKIKPPIQRKQFGKGIKRTEKINKRQNVSFMPKLWI